MDQGFPGQHTTTTTVTTTTTTVQPSIRFDKNYVKTLPGILKVVQAIAALAGFISVTASIFSNNSRGNAFNTFAMIGFWFTSALLVFYTFHVIEKFSRIPWLKIEFFFCAGMTAVLLIVSSFAADYAAYGATAYGFAAFFGFVAMLAYGYDAWLKWNAWKSGALAQGQRTPKQVSTVTSPAY